MNGLDPTPYVGTSCPQGHPFRGTVASLYAGAANVEIAVPAGLGAPYAVEDERTEVELAHPAAGPDAHYAPILVCEDGCLYGPPLSRLPTEDDAARLFAVGGAAQSRMQREIVAAGVAPGLAHPLAERLACVVQDVYGDFRPGPSLPSSMLSYLARHAASLRQKADLIFKDRLEHGEQYAHHADEQAAGYRAEADAIDAWLTKNPPGPFRLGVEQRSAIQEVLDAVGRREFDRAAHILRGLLAGEARP